MWLTLFRRWKLAQDRCQTKARHQDAAFLVEENVRGFEVPVDNPLGVGVIQGGSDHLDRTREVQRCERAGLQPVLQAARFSIGGDDVWSSFHYARADEREDVGMLNARDSPLAVDQPLEKLRVTCDGNREDSNDDARLVIGPKSLEGSRSRSAPDFP